MGASSLGCSRGEPAHRPVSFTPGREAEIRGAKAPIDATPSLLGTIAFWQDYVPAGTRNGKPTYWPGAAFLTSPFSGAEDAHRLEVGPAAYSVSAGSSSEGDITLAYVDSDSAGGSVVEVRTSRDGGRSWSAPHSVERETDVLRLDPDSLAPGPNGQWYLLVRYRLGKVKPGMLLRVYRKAPGEDWGLMGAVPGSDDLSTFDALSFDVSPGGSLAVAFVTYEGELRVKQSTDGGRTWVSIGLPDRPRMPGLRTLLPGMRPTVRDGMPSIRWIGGGWGLAWEEHVSIPSGLTGSDAHVDTLFSKHDAAGARWTRTTRINDQRIVLAGTVNILGQVGKSVMQALEDLHRKGRGTELRYPHLVVAPTGRFAVFWTELRGLSIVPVASISDDGGIEWSAAIALDSSHQGDTDRVRGSFSADGKALQAIYLTWPGESSLRADDGLGLKVAEVLLP